LCSSEGWVGGRRLALLLALHQLLLTWPAPCLTRPGLRPPRRSYVEKGLDKAGTELKLVVRGKQNDAVVAKMPFVKTTYYKG
jgi:hypothetical protein